MAVARSQPLMRERAFGRFTDVPGMRQPSRRYFMLRWNTRFMRASVAIAAFAALVIGSGADWRWN
jgi:hypothetical protein